MARDASAGQLRSEGATTVQNVPGRRPLPAKRPRPPSPPLTATSPDAPDRSRPALRLRSTPRRSTSARGTTPRPCSSARRSRRAGARWPPTPLRCRAAAAGCPRRRPSAELAWFQEFLAPTTAAGLMAFTGSGHATARHLTERQGHKRFTGFEHAASTSVQDRPHPPEHRVHRHRPCLPPERPSRRGVLRRGPGPLPAPRQRRRRGVPRPRPRRSRHPPPAVLRPGLGRPRLRPRRRLRPSPCGCRRGRSGSPVGTGDRHRALLTSKPAPTGNRSACRLRAVPQPQGARRRWLPSARGRSPRA